MNIEHGGDGYVTMTHFRSGKVSITRIPENGPGTELKKLLEKMGIRYKPGCPCIDHAMRMNQRGIGWCHQNIPKISKWIETEARHRKLPFSSALVRWLILRAIRNAENLKKYAPTASK
jgi:hypothetical protein